MLDQQAIAARSRRAIAAAVMEGRESGLAVSDAEVLHEAFSVVVHLRPSPVVARIPVVVPNGFDLAALAARQMRELAVAGWLADRGEPVVRPSPLVARRPAQRDGCSITFWEHVDVEVEAVVDYAARVPLVATLHRALRDYPGELPFVGPFGGLAASLTFLAQRPDLLAAVDVERAQREWAVLGPLLAARERFAAAFPRASVQPVHGDAPWYNMLRTKSGFVYADFEEVTVGPIELDLALLPDAAEAYDAAAARAGTRALDSDALRAVTAAARLNMVAALALAPQLPMLVDALAPSIAQWRSTPFAGGVSAAAQG